MNDDDLHCREEILLHGEFDKTCEKTPNGKSSMQNWKIQKKNQLFKFHIYCKIFWTLYLLKCHSGHTIDTLLVNKFKLRCTIVNPDVKNLPFTIRINVLHESTRSYPYS